VTRSIRVRIAFAVFTAVVTLVALQVVYTLDRFQRSMREEIDDRLQENAAELRAVLGSDQLDGWVEHSVDQLRRDEELFVEVRDADGRLVAHSKNLPSDGLAQGAISPRSDRLRYWERGHPRSHSGARRVRVLETWYGPWHVYVGMSLSEVQRWYWRLRRNLITSLVAIAVVGALTAYGVATRSLLPLARLAEEARALGDLPDGVLPRTHSGDEVDRLADVLNDLLHRVREEVLRVRRLTADAGHALRTPLTAIRGNLELQAAKADGPAGEQLGATIEQVDELIRIVNRLLLLEKLANPRSESPNRERLDLLALTRDLIDPLHVIAEERGVSLECRGDSVEVEADAGQVRQAVLNLIDNALRVTPRGGAVAVEVGSRAGAAEVAVSDSGPGIPADQLERVFERFYSTRSTGGGGTGLGLPIARAIARAHGGDVTASSPGGARFLLRLPLAGENSVHEGR
jgi:signal transduction histidine kinase